MRRRLDIRFANLEMRHELAARLELSRTRQHIKRAFAADRRHSL
jgi:hypothetical protein